MTASRRTAMSSAQCPDSSRRGSGLGRTDGLLQGRRQPVGLHPPRDLHRARDIRGDGGPRVQEAAPDNHNRNVCCYRYLRRLHTRRRDLIILSRYCRTITRAYIPTFTQYNRQLFNSCRTIPAVKKFEKTATAGLFISLYSFDYSMYNFDIDVMSY